MTTHSVDIIKGENYTYMNISDINKWENRPEFGKNIIKEAVNFGLFNGSVMKSFNYYCSSQN